MPENKISYTGVLRRMQELLRKPTAWIRGAEFGKRRHKGESHPGSYDAAARQDADCFCLVGAAKQALHESGADSDVGVFLRDVLVPQLPSQFGSIPAFNDHSNTTHGQVTDLLARSVASADRADVSRGV